MGSKRYKKHLAKALSSRTFLFPRDKLVLQKHSLSKFIENVKVQFNESVNLQTPDTDSLSY